MKIDTMPGMRGRPQKSPVQHVDDLCGVSAVAVTLLISAFSSFSLNINYLAKN